MENTPTNESQHYNETNTFAVQVWFALQTVIDLKDSVFERLSLSK